MAFWKIKNYVKLFISVFVVVSGVVFRNELRNMCYDHFLGHSSGPSLPEGIFTDETLAQYNSKKLYLAILGVVFDVTKGRKHYEKGAAYHYFVGKDGSRALVTGNFDDVSKNKDHVLDLSCTELLTLLHWRDTFTSRYKKVGIHVGRFYDKYGQKTAYSIELGNRVKHCEREKETSKIEDLKYPPCNIAWNAEDGTKVWCTTTSGGVKRSWVGVPHQLYTPGIEKPRCVCVNTDVKDSPTGLLKQYDNCPNTSTMCQVDT